MTHSTAPKTLSDRLDELTGYDEIAIEEHFDANVYDEWDTVIDSAQSARVSVKHMGRLKRMLLFVEKLRDLPAPMAFKAVMDLNLREINTALRLDELEDDDTATSETPDAAGDPEGKAPKSSDETAVA